VKKFQKLLDRIMVILKSFVTYAVAGSALIALYSPHIADLLPKGAGETVTAVSLKIIAILGGAVTIIRRVEQVEPEFRGLLPVEPATVPAPAVAYVATPPVSSATVNPAAPNSSTGTFVVTGGTKGEDPTS
jgi:hypothetical protein